jgi:hypothetical protein
MTEKEVDELQKKVQEKMDKLVPKFIPYVKFLHIVELKFQETKYTRSLFVKLDGKGNHNHDDWNFDWVYKSTRLVKQLFKIFLPEDTDVYVYWE